jgi:hypothetical protein
MCRVMGNLCLSFEEMSTILTQVEACLNSCPLCQILSNPKDPKALALGQFLIGGLIMAVPDSDYSCIPVNELSRWLLMQQCAPRHWRKWSMDYMHQLQQCYKWAY